MYLHSNLNTKFWSLISEFCVSDSVYQHQVTYVQVYKFPNISRANSNITISQAISDPPVGHHQVSDSILLSDVWYWLLGWAGFGPGRVIEGMFISLGQVMAAQT